MNNNYNNQKTAIEALLMLQDKPNTTVIPATMANAFQLQIQQQLKSSRALTKQVPANTPHNPNRSLLGPKQKQPEKHTRILIQKPVAKHASGNLNLSSVNDQESISRVMDLIKFPSPKAPSTSEYSFQNREQFVNLKDRSIKLPASQRTIPPSKHSEVEEVEDQSQMLPPKMPGWHGSSIYGSLPDAVQQEFDTISRESYYVKKESLEKLNSEHEEEASPVRKRKAGGEERNKNNEASKRSRQRKKQLNQVLQNSLDYDLDENYMLYKQEKWLIGIIKELEGKFLQDAPENRGIIRKMRRECGFEQ